MDRKIAINTVQNLRKQMHQDIDLKCDNIIERIKNGEALDENDNCIERTMPLNSLSTFFKGKKITAVNFSDGREIAVSKWKEAVQIILQDCNSDEAMHNALIDICGKVYGKSRVLFADTPADMVAPIQIDGDMYLETKFDVESLLNVLKNRILDFVGYDYSGISIKFTEPNISINEVIDNESEEPIGFALGGM